MELRKQEIARRKLSSHSPRLPREPLQQDWSWKHVVAILLGCLWFKGVCEISHSLAGRSSRCWRPSSPSASAVASVSRPSQTDSLLRITVPFSDDDGGREPWFLEQDYEKLFKKAIKEERIDGRRHTRSKLHQSLAVDDVPLKSS